MSEDGGEKNGEEANRRKDNERGANENEETEGEEKDEEGREESDQQDDNLTVQQRLHHQVDARRAIRGKLNLGGWVEFREGV